MYDSFILSRNFWFNNPCSVLHIKRSINQTAKLQSAYQQFSVTDFSSLHSKRLVYAFSMTVTTNNTNYSILHVFFFFWGELNKQIIKPLWLTCSMVNVNEQTPRLENTLNLFFHSLTHHYWIYIYLFLYWKH